MGEPQKHDLTELVRFEEHPGGALEPVPADQPWRQLPTYWETNTVAQWWQPLQQGTTLRVQIVDQAGRELLPQPDGTYVLPHGGMWRLQFGQDFPGRPPREA